MHLIVNRCSLRCAVPLRPGKKEKLSKVPPRRGELSQGAVEIRALRISTGAAFSIKAIPQSWITHEFY
jgi:hypothetical protein